MISFDTILLEFVKNNFITLSALIGAFISIAAMTKWKGDDKIAAIVKNFLTAFMPKRKDKK